jgi:hypothetical protein
VLGIPYLHYTIARRSGRIAASCLMRLPQS